MTLTLQGQGVAHIVSVNPKRHSIFLNSQFSAICKVMLKQLHWITQSPIEH